jgi:OmcA/MtrC family decaheme c-type cytochrome
VVPPVVVDVLTTNAVITAAAKDPASTNTAANPAQAFGLIAGVGGATVTVNSPPVVNFTVVDSTGKFVPGLKLANTTSSAAGLAADPNCSQTNVTFAMAKFENGNWQNLISRQRYTTTDLTERGTKFDTNGNRISLKRYAVVEGTTDPKPTAPSTVTKADGTTVANFSYANPATAVTDPATRIVGILEENTANGYYTYRFATDVVTPLLMADATDVKNVSLGKVANNGKVAVKDGATVHRVGAQLCYTDPVTKAKVVVNPTFDFTLGANGVAVPVTTPRKVVDKASCNECHEPITAHGTRVDPNYCVICHNPGSVDFNTNNKIDLKLMVHRIHSGKELTKDFQVNALVIKATDPITKVAAGTGYPQDVKNCVKCHTGTAAPAGSTSGTNVTANGDNWKKVPSINACGACHDGIDFATGKGVTLADANKGLTVSAYGHVGGSKADDSQCLLCHTAADNAVYHETVYTAGTSTGLTGAQTAAQKSLPAGTPTLSYQISAVTVAGTPKRASVTFKILMNGNAAKLNAYSAAATEMVTGFLKTGPSIYLAYSVPQDGVATPADFNFNTNASVANLWDGTKGTLTANADGSYTALLGLTTATGLDIPDNASMVTAAIIGSFKQTVAADTNKYPAGLTIPGQAVQKTATGYTARRVVASTAKCNACHEQLGVVPNFHSGARNDATLCAFCHNPNQGSSGWSADAATFFHGIHGSSKRAVAFTPDTSGYADGAKHFKNVVFPSVLKNCLNCHEANTFNWAAPTSVAAVPNLLFKTVAKGIYNKSTTVLTKAPTFDANGVANSGGSTSLTLQSAATVAQISPYVTADNATDYGIGFSYTAYRAAAAAKAATATAIAQPAIVSETAVTRPAAPTTLVISPFAASCFSCHDGNMKSNPTSTVKTHIEVNGGVVYAPRSSVYAAGTTTLANREQCLSCHSATATVSPIAARHGL